MILSEAIRQKPNANALKQWIEKVPYATFLGIKAEIVGDSILFTLPQDKKLLGNPSLPALHGGVVGAFMEQAGAFHLIANMEAPVLPKIINFSLDYLRPAELRDTFAQCEVTRQGRTIANVTVTAWQERPDKANAIARAHFLLPDAN